MGKRVFFAVGTHECVDALFAFEAKTATKYFSDTHVVSATLIDKGRNAAHVRVKIGKPNFAQRAFIARQKELGTKLSSIDIVLKFPPRPKKSKSKK